MDATRRVYIYMCARDKKLFEVEKDGKGRCQTIGEDFFSCFTG
jgi:hypothetical protein